MQQLHSVTPNTVAGTSVLVCTATPDYLQLDTAFLSAVTEHQAVVRRFEDSDKAVTLDVADVLSVPKDFPCPQGMQLRWLRESDYREPVKVLHIDYDGQSMRFFQGRLTGRVRNGKCVVQISEGVTRTVHPTKLFYGGLNGDM